MTVFTELEKNLQLLQKHRRLEIAKETKLETPQYLISKHYLQNYNNQNSMVPTDSQMSGPKQSLQKYAYVSTAQRFSAKASKIYTGKKTTSTINGARETEFPYAADRNMNPHSVQKSTPNGPKYVLRETLKILEERHIYGKYFKTLVQAKVFFE